ncbi:baseplate J/gp47 family protein (plasmid) [Entomospira entomophila]|uniref:Baseplate J-like central domain-containing protein n=1 Tax=Entomospira entomophila TaxID=2719988 RepID=A0A968GBU7_9SPIO|nr:baseplate J/gp47 family protein [Entomospira entomophilus]NIZ41500.1 hypothetical protein [Entomospira entomophilus]WDI36416.1 baseplate J/gp47 family protein [Entomospira entomophilus]
MKIPSREELMHSILETMQSSLKERGATLPLSSRSVWAILAGVLASALGVLYIYGSWIYRQIFPQTQDESALLLEGERFGIFPKSATPTKVKAIATGLAGSLIPSGWQASVQGSLFRVEESVEIEASGTAIVSLVALDDGALPVVSSLTLTRSIAGVENTLAVESWLSGSDAESLVAFRSRMISLRRNRPQGGAISDYLAWSLEVEGIARVLVLSRQMGVVLVYPLASLTGEDRLPTEEKRRQLEEHLNQEDLAPLGVADVMVGIFSQRVIDIRVSTLYPNNPTLRNNITQAWQLYLWQRFPRQFASQEEANQTISEAEILALAVSSGARQIELELMMDGEIVHVYDLAYNEIAKLGEVIWS